MTRVYPTSYLQTSLIILLRYTHIFSYLKLSCFSLVVSESNSFRIYSIILLVKGRPWVFTSFTMLYCLNFRYQPFLFYQLLKVIRFNNIPVNG